MVTAEFPISDPVDRTVLKPGREHPAPRAGRFPLAGLEQHTRPGRNAPWGNHPVVSKIEQNRRGIHARRNL